MITTKITKFTRRKVRLSSMKDYVTQNNYSYSGIIEEDDFNTNSPNKNRIANQLAADRFQDKMRRHQESYEEKLTLNDYKKLKLVSNTDGRPSSKLTDAKWQKEFEIRKQFVIPYCKKSGITKMQGMYARESGTWNEETQGIYKGCTNWQQYCSYINDILRNIRGGQVDYCYYIFQIMDLLKFHHDDLKTRYCDEYWEVWLER